MTLTEKVAYLKGLVEGIGVDETTNQGKIMKAVLDVLDDMAPYPIWRTAPLSCMRN